MLAKCKRNRMRRFQCCLGNCKKFALHFCCKLDRCWQNASNSTSSFRTSTAKYVIVSTYEWGNISVDL